MSSDIATLRRKLGKKYRLIPGGNGHWKVMDGDTFVTSLPNSPNGGNRSLENSRAAVRRYEKGKA